MNLSLRRITSGGSYIPEIDGLRFVAIASVVIYHTYVQTDVRVVLGGMPFWIEQLRRGVELCFIISGFILGLPFAKQYLAGGKQVRIGAYFLRRLTRLEPPYILILCIRAAGLLAATHALGYIATHLLANILYVHSLWYGYASVIHFVTWSLEIEVQFYCLAPLLAMIFLLRPAWIRRLLLLIAFIARGYAQLAWIPGAVPGVYSRVGLTILDWAQFFLAGFLLADIYATDWKSIPESWGWDVASVLAWLGIFLLPPSPAHVWIAPLSLVAYTGAFKGKLFPAFFRFPAVPIIGGMCYSLYLTHPIVFTVMKDLLHRMHLERRVPAWGYLAVTDLVCIPAILLVGTIYFVLIERPCMDRDWPKKLMARLRGKRAVCQVA